MPVPDTRTDKIDEIADKVVERIIANMKNGGGTTLRSIVWQAISEGMFDAYNRGLAVGPKV